MFAPLVSGALESTALRRLERRLAGMTLLLGIVPATADSSAAQAQEAGEFMSFAVPQSGRVVIDHVARGDVSVMTVPGREGRVWLDDLSGFDNWGIQGPDLVRFDETSDGIRIMTGTPAHDASYANLFVWLPEDVVNHLSVNGSEGNITVLGINDVDVVVTAYSGDVRVFDAARTTVRVHSASGDAILSDIGSADIWLMHGNAWIDEIEGIVSVFIVDGNGVVTGSNSNSVSIETGSGNIWYEGAIRDEGRYSLSSHNGDVVFYVPEGANASLSASTFEGRFDPSFDLDFLRGRVRNGILRGGEFGIGESGPPVSGMARVASVLLRSFYGDIYLIRPGETMPGQPVCSGCFAAPSMPEVPPEPRAPDRQQFRR